MKRHMALAILVSISLSALGAAAETHPLVGTWRKVSGRQSKDGEWVAEPRELTMLKHITPTHVSWAIFRTDNNEIVAAMGGAVEMDGTKYVETVEHGLGGVMSLQGKKQPFTWKIEGNRFTQAGYLSNGVYIEERYDRVVPEKVVPEKVVPEKDAKPK